MSVKDEAVEEEEDEEDDVEFADFESYESQCAKDQSQTVDNGSTKEQTSNGNNVAVQNNIVVANDNDPQVVTFSSAPVLRGAFSDLRRQ